jgi:phosphopantothenoylcysteine decarboxylase/phosphopantothenate--cysteine ligase
MGADARGDLAGRRLLVGLTGGVAAYKTCELVRRLQDHGARVQAVMTRAACEFVTPTTLQALTGRAVLVDMWTDQDRQHAAGVHNAMPHIDLSRQADALIVAPASAHFLARAAQGLADDLLSTLALARRCPMLVAPAMNVEMWTHPATQRNVRQLQADGVLVLGPGVGDQACGETGAGRMLEPHELLDDVIAFFQPKLLQGRQVLITAGPTFEPIDPVRGITNLSSGKMGFALARAAHEAGAAVTVVAGPTSLPTPRGVLRIDVQTAVQMHQAVLSRAAQADVFIAVAAVADWRVVAPATGKLKKADGPPAPTFEQNPDILADLAQLPDAPFCVGFAAETDDVLRHAQAKLKTKRVPMIVANRAQDLMGADGGELLIVDNEGSTALPAAGKMVQARRIVADVARRLVRPRSA